jgi:SAM-dependent methyltransferase
MSSADEFAALRARLHGWFDQPLGRSLWAAEAARLRPTLSALSTTVAIQIGDIGGTELLDSCAAPLKILVENPVSDLENSVVAMPDALPFDSASVDLALLPHTLDFANDPHDVLREVDRVLSPEGHVVVLGFNPYSLWGLRRLFRRRSAPVVPWNAHFISLYRIKDWLKLLNFEISEGAMVYYRPPLCSQAAIDRLYLLDAIGNRWWPMAAAVYMLVARKRVKGMTPIRPRWRLRAVPDSSVPQATACGRAAARMRIVG